MKRSVLSLAVGAALVISDATACTTILSVKMRLQMVRNILPAMKI